MRIGIWSVAGLLLAMMMGACSPIVEKTGKPELVGKNRCDKSTWAADASTRLYRIRFVDKDFGRSPSDTVEVQGATSSTSRTYVGRAVPTELVETESSWPDWLVWALVAEWVLLGVTFLFSGAPDGAEGKTAGRRRRRLAGVLMAALLIALPVTGFLAGSRFYVDNAYDVPVKVVIDGGSVVQVPARSAVPVRLSGFRHEAVALIEGEQVEVVRLVPDSDLWDMIWRTIWSRGEFVYNVCGENAYDADTAYYSR